VNTLQAIPDASGATVLTSLTVVAVILGSGMLSAKIPGALIAVVGSIVVSRSFDLASHGVSSLGKVPGGLPSIGLPDAALSDVPPLAGIAVSMFVVILAQSAATSRAYAARYHERLDENVDMVGLGMANLAAGLSGTFVVNGSPTKTQIADSAGGRTQLTSLTTAAVVLAVLLFLTGPLQYLPNAVLAAIVFLIGIELVDALGLRRIRRSGHVLGVRDRAPTAVIVIVWGVTRASILAIILSVIAHLRRSYRHPWNDRASAHTGAMTGTAGPRRARATARSGPRRGLTAGAASLLLRSPRETRSRSRSHRASPRRACAGSAGGGPFPRRRRCRLHGRRDADRRQPE
jgi:MFS superfamily sulfate permease-like transporter